MMKDTTKSLEAVLVKLISSLEVASTQLKTQTSPSLADALHSTENLPDAALYQLASKALDVLSEVQLLLEPGQLLLADHFMGTHIQSKDLGDSVYISRVHEHESACCGC